MMLTIGQLAATTREPVKTLRFWTDRGLLSAERGGNGYRYYHPDATKRISFIRRTQAIGFSLREIRGILGLRDEGLQPCDEVRSELAAHLAAARSRIAELQDLERELAVRLAWANTEPDPQCDEGCVYLTEEPQALAGRV